MIKSQINMTDAFNGALLAMPADNYSPKTTKPKWFTNGAYAHFGKGAFGVNG